MFASASTSLKFHEFPSGDVLHHYQPRHHISGPIRSISWSRDGNWLAFVPYSGHAEIVSVKNQLKLIHTIQAIEDPSCAAFQNTTRKNIAIGTKTGDVLIYDIKAKKVKKTLSKISSGVTRIEFTPKDGHVIAAGRDGEVYIYSHVHNNLSGSFKIPRSESISALRANPMKRNYVVAGSDEGVVAVWDMHSNKHKFYNGSHKAPITGVAFSPISSDVVVSTGLDRQFCFYDIGAGKCIGSIFVENNMTAVDFSPDGKFVVMGSQKGKIYIYDVKNTHQPVYTFEGNNGSIEHLLFRKNEGHENSFSISSDNIKETNVETNESLGIDITTSQDSVISRQGSTNVEDSFLAAMGMDQNNTAESTGYQPLDKQTFSNTPINQAKILQEKIQNSTGAPVTSTPDVLCPEPYLVHSPIVTSGSDGSHTLAQNFEQSIRTVVKEELKAAMEEFKKDNQNYLWQRFFEIRGLILDLFMFITKRFIKVENHLGSYRGELTVENQNYEDLVEENFILKRKINELQQQISVLKMNEH